ncbi:DUF3060 domain-containing protein [Actinomyces sp. MRS3W]|uniref:DUF3060 domain-containing protein n=1 Tax=Actinomyces sp. MRS3W TaxID=2800796 RepID=UPI0028FD6502|nr:hypothetical protein [Actinomyces sp. MRS3W]MDU0347472.1 hypothetical protein [Actinomyces sp. MRS3W]
MHVPRKLLIPAAVLAVGASLAACSINVGSSDQGATNTDSSAAAVDATTQAADDAEAADADADDTDAAQADDSAADDADDAEASSGATDITDQGWLDAMANGTQQTVSGSYAIEDAGGTYNLVGELDSLSVAGSEVVVAAERVDNLNIAASDVTVYVRQVNQVQILGSDVTVYYLDGSPSVQDAGADNTVEQLTN